jgi:lipopolysaccharide/colanic/teichoic acid biosynthesis glycosyltransferase
MIQNSENVGPSWTTDGDHRITGVGKFLRRTAMDELPSIISIWKGDMSFVGPRALDVNEERLLEEEIPDFACRLNVLPGLTGLAQIKDKFDVATVKLQYDLEYIQRMNIWLDLWIMIVSVINTITAKWDQRAGKKK